MALNIVNEAGRCLNCRNPKCKEACPVSTSIPEVIQMFKGNNIMEAGEKLFDNNPMSVICATVCNHEAQCTGHCVLGRKGQPVRFYEIEHFISDAYLDRMKVEAAPSNGKNVAVIGSGPAGMTVAIKLAQQGFNVTIFEEKDKIGGMLQYGIPEFRLPKTILERYKERLLEMGVHIRPNTVLGGDLRIDDLFRDGYKAVFIGTGTWRPKKLGLHGESLSNVHFGISYLSNPSAYTLGKTVAVIGMGNVAMDVARTAFRHGAERVMLFARSRRIAASEDETTYTQLDGAEFIFGRQIKRFTEEGPVFDIAVLDEDNKVIGYDGEELVKADTTIIAVSQGPKNKLVLTTAGLESDEKGLLIVDENMMTTREGVFAAGDVVHGSMTVVHAVEDSKKAADAMMRYMLKEI